jgi:hypothetical protein
MTTDNGRLEQDEREATEERDPELGRMLSLWRTPAVPEGLDRQVLADFRTATARRAWWRRLLEFSIPVPLPVAVAALLLLVVSALVLLRQPALPRESPLAANGAAMTADESLVTRTSLAGFEPVDDMNVAVVTEGDKR